MAKGRGVLKWVGIVFGGLIGLLALALVAANVLAITRLNRQYNVTPAIAQLPTDEAALARGEYLVEAVSHCSGCHEPDLGGKVFLDDPMIGQFFASNLTSGAGGIGAHFSDEDWARALLHGVAPDGRMLLVMPSQYFNHYSDYDLHAVIAYLKSVPPVDRQFPEKKLSFMGNTVFGMGLFGQMPAEIIDHRSARPSAPQPGVSAEYGEYLVNIAVCKDCHDSNLAGGRPEPDAPWASNLTPGGPLAGWSEAEFVEAIRTGITPAGHRMNPFMPWEGYRNMTDEDLRAIWVFLQSLPELAENPR
jgi:mono/diheme cytochrome c family protein